MAVRSRTRLWSVRTPYRTLRPVFRTPFGMCVTSCHWQEFVDIAVPLAHVFDRSQPQKSQSGSFSGRNVDPDQTTVGCRFVCVFGSSAANDAQGALVFGFPRTDCMYGNSHSSRLCLGNGRSSGEFWHDHTCHGGHHPPNVNIQDPSEPGLFRDKIRLDRSDSRKYFVVDNVA